MSESPPFSIVIAPPVPVTALRTAAASLAEGAFINFTPHPYLIGSEGLAWQTQWFYDPARRIAHLLAKRANDDDDWRHQIYDEISNTWRNGNWFVDQSGHIYGNTAFDPKTGDLYQRCGNEAFVRRWTFATNSWDFQTSAFAANISGVAANGLVWHPNLFGPNEDGLIYCGPYNGTAGTLRGWKASTNTWDWFLSIPRTSNRYHGAGCYHSGLQKTLIGSCDTIVGENRQTPYLVTGGVTPSAAIAALTPVDMSTGDAARMAMGPVIRHPRDSSKLLQVQRGASISHVNGGNGAWVSSDALTWTQISNHPYPSGSFVACSIPEDGYGNYGVVWLIGVEDSVLWRPPL